MTQATNLTAGVPQAPPFPIADAAALLRALVTTHRGASRPALMTGGTVNVDKEGLWIKTASGSAWELRYYDGSSDILLGTIDPTAHTWTAAKLASSTTAGRLARYSDTVGSQGQTTGLFEDGSGNVGIANTSPGYKLDITGDGQISATLRLAATTSSSTGVVLKGGNRFIHDYKAPSSDGGNVFIGLNAGNFTMAWDGVNSYTASNNVGIGSIALLSNTTGYGNLAIGSSSLVSNTTGFTNAAVGFAACYSNTTGLDNLAIGSFSLFLNTTGRNNVSIGANALYNLNITNNTDGQNTAIGYNTGGGITTGKNNTIIGANVTGLAAGLTGNIILADGTGAVKLQYNGTSWAVTGGFGRGAPVTKTNDFTLSATENWVICNKAGTTTVTLPAASGATGREVTIKTITANTVISDSSNVVPQVGGAASTAILAATAGKWATLVSDGSNWIIMTSN